MTYRISKQIKILYPQEGRDQGLISFRYSRNVDKILFGNDPRQSMAFEKSRSSCFADYTGSNEVQTVKVITALHSSSKKFATRDL